MTDVPDTPGLPSLPPPGDGFDRAAPRPAGACDPRADRVSSIAPFDPPDIVGRIPPTALLDLRRLATLREVARCGSYAAAAETLHFTPSAVSQQMAGLARDLGSALFERTPRGMRITAAAEALVGHLDAIFARLNEAQGQLDAVAGGVAGRLRVGSFPTATVRFVAQAMGAFQDRFPQVEFSFFEGEPYESVGRLKERAIDLAAVFDFDHLTLSTDYDGRIVCQDREIDCLELFDDPFSIMLPGNHPLAQRERIEIADLEGERLLGGPSGCSPWEGDLRVLCRRVGFDPAIERRYQTVDFAALQAIVATGRGITLVPELALLPPHPTVVVRPLVDRPVRHVAIATLAGVPLTPAAQIMIELLQETAVSWCSLAPALAIA